MTFTAVAGILASVATIFGALMYFLKWGDQKFTKTPDQKDQDIQKQVADEQKQAEETGRPV